MNIYLKNALIALLGVGVLLFCSFTTFLPEIWAGYAIFIAPMFIARGVGKIINEFALTLYKNKKTSKTESPAREQAVHHKSVIFTMIICLFILTVVTMKPALFGNPNNMIIFSVTFFVWHLINIPVYIYMDKNFVMKIK